MNDDDVDVDVEESYLPHTYKHTHPSINKHIYTHKIGVFWLFLTKKGIGERTHTTRK
jgi:hypothetical protein